MNEDMSFYDTHKFILWQARQEKKTIEWERDDNIKLFNDCIYEMLELWGEDDPHVIEYFDTNEEECMVWRFD